MGAENPFQVRVVKGLAVRLRGSGNRLQRLAVRAVKGHAMTAQILEEDPPVFLPGGEAAERPAPGVKQDIFKAPAPGAVDTETRRPPLVHPEGVRDRKSGAGMRVFHRAFMARSISRLASRWAAASRLS